MMGQGTVEYALVAIGLFAVVMGLSVLARVFIGGSATELLLGSLTHRLPKGVADVILF